MKVIAFYLPQFHTIPENDKWWGKEFTEWVNVKGAKPLYSGHVQPKIPLNENYYNLLDDSIKKWQVNLAKEYGVYGFCYYHYWFNGKLLLEKPMEQMLNNEDIDLPFCISWANEPWTRAWVGDEKKVLLTQKYGGMEEWRKHFEYLLPFLKDNRYINIDGKPMILIYRPQVIECVADMMDYWRELAIEYGLEGLHITSQMVLEESHENDIASVFDSFIEFQPGLCRNDISRRNGKLSFLKKARRKIAGYVEKKWGIDVLRYGQHTFSKINNLNFISYDDAWGAILSRVPKRINNFPGAFVRWDNSPRHGNRARIYKGETPQKFEHYMSIQVERARKTYKKDFLFLYAWNEWAEGGYMEPDEEYGYEYLEALKNALINKAEFPNEKSND